jgi:hypothetical protein
MTLADFVATLSASAPPAVRPVLLALWYDGRGDWEHAHTVAQNVPDSEGAWVHAYLHRKEGDVANAAYWYQRAGRSAPSGSFTEEWQTIAAALLATD